MNRGSQIHVCHGGKSYWWNSAALVHDKENEEAADELKSMPSRMYCCRNSKYVSHIVTKFGSTGIQLIQVEGETITNAHTYKKYLRWRAKIC